MDVPDAQAVAKLLSKAAPSNDLYFYLRAYSSQDPEQAEVYCVKASYLNVNFYRLSLSIVDPM